MLAEGLEGSRQPQRLLWASTGTNDPASSDILYIRALAASDIINTIPEKTRVHYGQDRRWTFS